MYPDCVRCGMCCIAMPCAFSETNDDDICIYLSVNDDDTTTCHNKKAKALYIGSGCAFMTVGGKEIYNDSMKFYAVNEMKQEIKMKQGAKIQKTKTIGGNRGRIYG